MQINLFERILQDMQFGKLWSDAQAGSGVLRNCLFGQKLSQHPQKLEVEIKDEESIWKWINTK